MAHQVVVILQAVKRVILQAVKRAIPQAVVRQMMNGKADMKAEKMR
jgi:hypothetical protein